MIIMEHLSKYFIQGICKWRESKRKIYFFGFVLTKQPLYFSHIAEHMEVPIDTSKMSDQELQFHYFKMHDADNNNKLDGCELIKSLIHWHGKLWRGFIKNNLFAFHNNIVHSDVPGICIVSLNMHFRLW